MFKYFLLYSNLFTYRSLEYGIYMLKFHSRMWDLDDEDPNWTRKLPFEGIAYTYIEIIPTPLFPSLMESTLTYVTRGHGQFINFFPGLFSYDPDYPEDGVKICMVFSSFKE